MSTLTIVVSWFIFSFVVAQYAENKGRNFFVWLIVAFVFSPLITWIVLLVTPVNAAKVEQRKIQSGMYKRCPECAETIQVKATKCRYCSHSFLPST